jgi:flagellar biosynthetic protein FliQ
MTIDAAVFYGQLALLTVMYVAGPLMLVALVVGSVVSVFQTVTQIQEITLVFIPKIIAVFAVIAIGGGWMLQLAVAFGVQMFEMIPIQ